MAESPSRHCTAAAAAAVVVLLSNDLFSFCVPNLYQTPGMYGVKSGEVVSS